MSLATLTAPVCSPPPSLPSAYTNFPEELRAENRWLVWKLQERKGKPTKVPFNASTGKFASSTDSSTWTTFDRAVKARGYDGIGCAISPPYVGIDLDKCRDPQTGFTEPWAERIIREIGSYTELSPSGRGYHIWVKDQLAVQGSKKSRVEIYGQGRYFTVTGQHVAGTPHIIEVRDLTGLHARLVAGELEPGVAPAAAPAAATAIPEPDEKLFLKDELLAGRWLGHYPSQSEADLALCGRLAADFSGDARQIDATFRRSGLYRAKWDEKHGTQTYGEKTIAKAIADYRDEAPVEIEDAVPEPYPDETIDGDYIGELTRELTNGTPIPPAFARQTVKTVVGALVNGYVGFPSHEDLHTRQYSINVSIHPHSGKGESWKRVAEYKTGALHRLLQHRDSSSHSDHARVNGVAIVEGGQFSSGEKLPSLFEEAPRIIGRFDEMSELFQKFNTKASTLEDKMTTLYEREIVSHGSLTNGQHECRDAQLSYVGDFTADKFHYTFIGRGSRGSGFLSRNIITYADKTPLTAKEWVKPDGQKINRIVKRIEERINTLQQVATRLGDTWQADSYDDIPESDRRFIPTEDEDAKQLRHEFYDWLDAQDAVYSGRLKDHFKRDLLLRALFAPHPEMAITADLTRRSIIWTKRQLQDRMKLWPSDAGSLAEITEHKILDAIKKHRMDRYDQRKLAGLTDRELIKFANVSKPGSGGHETYNRAKKALLGSRTLKVVGHTHKGSPIYDSLIQ